MDERVGFTVERAPSRKRLHWRGPFLLVLLLTFAVGYYLSRPQTAISGQYKGFIGGQYSNDKTSLNLRIVQQGAELRGDCLLTHQRGRTVVKQTGRLVGTVASDKFKVRAACDQGMGILFEGQYVSQGSRREVLGTCYFINPQGTAGEGIPFMGRFANAWSPPNLLRDEK